jgi:hypothetical protein
MPAGVDDAAVALGAAVVKIACKRWFGDGSVVQLSDTITDMLRARVGDVISQRKLSRMFEDFIDVVADKALKIDRPEFRGLEENERAAHTGGAHGDPSTAGHDRQVRG